MGQTDNECANFPYDPEAEAPPGRLKIPFGYAAA